MMKLIAVVIMISACTTGCSRVKPVPMNFTGGVVVSKFNTDNTINGNPYTITNDVMNKLQESFFKSVLLKTSATYNVSIADKCGKNTLELQGEILKVSTDTDLKLNPVFLLLSHRELVTQVLASGRIVDCETKKVLKTFELDERYVEFDKLVGALANKIMDQFEYIAAVKVPPMNSSSKCTT